ncbi:MULTISPECIES: NAD(P)H-dependent oxidoreductase [Glaesserella]|uniref:NAD(P)H-dependent oxidoreductase n=1 Tax=Glaesserella australis TaxID=2094024 RepID=A0A328BVQ8_9PAST|nr:MULTISPECIES: NAD(P)H-dependent oxidoreductase [Glaesserella]AUI66017.1 NAD(P)H-dependent oxidoreductase [Glaesserella sp. 15-184]RAL18263.1 NAD(P)H-dependent oxidoreductase [Glaesserella australis]
MNKDEILAAYHFRHACKVYDPSKKISDDDFRFILETGRLSPSSFGFEPWKFLVIENPEIKQLIRENAWGAGEKATDASHFVVILVRHQTTLDPNGDYLPHFMRTVQQLPEDAIAMRLNFFRQYSQFEGEFADNPRAFYDWACKQSYIALGNMLTAAAMIGIDSTPIEGFPYAKMEKLLAEKGLFDPKEFKLSVMVAFGYRKQESRPKTRQVFEQVVEFIK